MTRLSRFQAILLTGLVIRLVMAPFLAHPFDMYAWYRDGENLLNGTSSVWNFLAPYDYSLFLFVFPATIAFKTLSGLFGSYTIPISSLSPVLNPGPQWNITVVPGPLFDLLVKLPLIASDAIVALLLYRLVLRHMKDKNLASSAALGWFLNPLVIWVSSGWGMFDTLPAMFTLLALYLAMESRFTRSSLALAVAIGLKYYALVLVIPFLIIVWRMGGRKASGVAVVSLTLAVLLLFAPLIGEAVRGQASLPSIVPYYSSLTSTSSGLSYSGLTFWTAITLFTQFSNETVVSAMVIVTSLLAAYYWMSRKKVLGIHLCVAFFGIPLVILLVFFKFVGENYVVWLIPFASILVARERRAKTIFWLLSVVAAVSSITNSPLPYYMLPMARWIGGDLAKALSLIAPYRIAPTGSVTNAFSVGKVALSAFGLLASVSLILLLKNWMTTVGRPSVSVRSDEASGGGKSQKAVRTDSLVQPLNRKTARKTTENLRRVP